MRRTRILLWILVLSLLNFLLSGCIFSTDSTLGLAEYSSEHFQIYYDESLYSLDDIVAIAEKKERLLNRINTFLETDFDDTISVTLVKSTNGEAPAWANTNKQIVEGYSYVVDDCGHEIVHVVTFEEIGYSKFDFFSEGFAVAVEFSFKYPDAITRFVEYRQTLDLYYELDTSWRMQYDNIYDQIIYDTFSGDYYDYIQAGAFIQYLINRYGITVVKDIYRVSVDSKSGYEFSIEILRKYGINLKKCADDFYLDNFG